MSKRKEIEVISEMESWDIKDLIPYEKNHKVHTEEQINSLAKIFKERGFLQPISVDEDGVILAGHGRRLAAIKAGMKRVPVIVITGKTQAEKSAIRISDNLIGRGQIDEKIMNEELSLLSGDDGINFETLGLNNEELIDISDLLDIDLGIEIDLSDLDEIDDAQDDKGESDESAKTTTALSGEKQNTPELGPRDSVDEYEHVYSVIVECDNEADQQAIYSKLTEEGRKCKVLSM